MLIKEMCFEHIRLEEAAKSDAGTEYWGRRRDRKKNDEIYHQIRCTVEESACKAIGFPHIFQDINIPVSIINNKLENLDQNWESSSFTRLKYDIETLREQSDHPHELLKQLAGDNPKT